MKLKVCFVVVLFAVAAFLMNSTPGSQQVGESVSDQTAESLHGGCTGVGEAFCSGKVICSGIVYGSGGDLFDADAGSIPAYWCKVKVNGEEVCNVCSATYVTCNISIDPVPVFPL